MRKRMIQISCFVLLTILLLFAVACGKKKQEQNAEQNVTTEENKQENESDANSKEDTAQSGVNEEAGADSSDTEGDTGENPDKTEQTVSPERVNIYTIDDATLDTSSVTVMLDVSDGLKPDAVVNAVILALEDHMIEVEIISTTVEDGKAVVDISAENENQPFGNEGSSVEGAILDCISYSLFENFSDINEIYFRVNGGPFESGHIYLPEDEPYLKK